MRHSLIEQPETMSSFSISSRFVWNVVATIALVTVTSVFIYHQRKSRPRVYDRVDAIPVQLRDPAESAAVSETPSKLETSSDASALDAVHAELHAWQLKSKSFQRPASDGVRQLRVCVVGLGGVGSHCAMVLARAGVGELRLIDFDQVTLSSLNRHAVAERADVGLPKVYVMQRHIAQACGPACRVDARRALFNEADAERLLCEPYLPDVLVDCIDNVDTKAYLIEFCVRRNIGVVVCTGSGARLDPAPMIVNDLQESHTDPLIRAIRRVLRKERDVGRGVRCVASDEVPVAQLQPVPEESVAKVESAGELAVLPNFRVRIMPVYSPLPCAFGSVLAQEVLHGVERPGTVPVTGHLSDKQVSNLKNRLATTLLDGELTMATRDIEAAFDRVWHGRHSFQDDAPLVGLVMVRWRLTRPCDRDNVALLGGNELKAHAKLLTALHRGRESQPLTVERETTALVQLYGAEAVAKVDARLAEARDELEQLMRAVA